MTATLLDRQLALQARCLHPSGTFEALHDADIDQSLVTRFEDIARRYPDRPALCVHGQSVDYEDLNTRANRIARTLIAANVAKGARVGILLDKGIDAIAALLGVMKAGGVMVLLDPMYPEDRLAFMVTHSDAVCVLSHPQHAQLANAFGRNVIMVTDTDAGLPNTDLGIEIGPRDPYAIFYTSGSTSTPKGVVLTHRGTLYHIKCYANAVHICPDDKLTLLHSLSFEACEFNLYGALLTGASLHLIDPTETTPTELASWVARSAITLYHSIPAVFQQVADGMEHAASMPSVRLVHLSGSPAAPSDLDLYRQIADPGCLFMHRMGATEVQNIRWMFMDQATRIDGTVLPIGYQVEVTQVLLLDESGAPVAPGEIGEIAVKSPYLSLGYWNRPDLTEAAFDLFDDDRDMRQYRTGDLGRIDESGCLFHMGRKDSQVKIRGHRIEIAEIEGVLKAHRGVRAAVVVAQASADGEMLLVAHCETRGVSHAGPKDLRSYAAQTLPSYMVPSYFNTVNALPTLPNGKVNRRALPRISGHVRDPGHSFVAPRTPVEIALCQLWADLLELEEVGIDETFFDLGGNSLLAMRLASDAAKTFHIEFAMPDLLRAATVEEMARQVVRQMLEAVAPSTGTDLAPESGT